MAIFSKKRNVQQDRRAELLKSLTNISKETEDLEKLYLKLSLSIEELKEKQVQDSSELHNEILILNRRLDLAKKRLSMIIYEFKRMATTFNYIVKKEELETLKRKVNLWSPENLITKKGFEKMIEEAKNQP